MTGLLRLKAVHYAVGLADQPILQGNCVAQCLVMLVVARPVVNDVASTEHEK